MNESEKQFSFTRAASSTGGRAKGNFIYQLLLGIALIAGCATPPAYPAKLARDCRYNAAKEGVTMGVQPVFSKMELSHYFETDLVSRGILPLLCVVQNNSVDASYLLLKTNCTVVEAVGVASKEDLPTLRTQGLVIEAIFGLGIGEGMVYNATRQRTSLADNELNDQTVSPGESARGFVYMKIPKNPPARGASMHVQVRLPRIATTNQLDFDLPITWER